MIPKNPLFQSQNKAFLKQFRKDMRKKEGQRSLTKFNAQVMQSLPYEAVEEDMVSYVQELLSKNRSAMVLSNGWTGPYGSIQSLEDLMIHNLKHCGYDFSSVWDASFEGKFQDLTQKGKLPAFKGGVLLTAGVSKGATLRAFLKRAGLKPDALILIDDQVKNLKSLEVVAQEMAIPFIGIHYVALKEKKHKPLSPQQAKDQWEALRCRYGFESQKESN